MQIHQFPSSWPSVFKETLWLETIDFLSRLKPGKGGPPKGAPRKGTSTNQRAPLREALQRALGLHPDILYLLAHTAPSRRHSAPAAAAAVAAVAAAGWRGRHRR